MDSAALNSKGSRPLRRFNDSPFTHPANIVLNQFLILGPAVHDHVKRFFINISNDEFPIEVHATGRYLSRCINDDVFFVVITRIDSFSKNDGMTLGSMRFDQLYIRVKKTSRPSRI